MESLQSIIMTVDELTNNDSDFIMEDNILKKSLSAEYTNVGKLLLDRMKAKPDFVGQSDTDFIKESNVLKGKEEPLSTEYTNIGKLLLDRMKAKPDFIGQIDVITEETYTFAEMFDRTVKCALWLRQQGIKANDVVAVCAPNIMDSFVPIFASFCVGAIFTAWNVAMDIREARYLMKLSGAKIVFADKSAVDKILEAAKLENYDIKVVVFGNASNALPFSKVLEGHSKFDLENFECTSIDNVQNTAGLLYSSGTTGLPKGVEISHFALLSNVLLPGDFNTEGIPLWLSPYFWMTGVLLTLSSVVNYCRRLLYPTFEEEMTCKIIEKYKVTWMFLSPSMANRIIKSGFFEKYNVSSISKLNLSGAVFTEKSQIKLKECFPSADVIQIFGMTEFCGIITTQEPHHKAGSIGTVRRNAQIKIIDLKTKCVLGPNQTGELLGKSLTMMNGYYNNPQATKDAIDDDGWLHTGDLAYYDENGELFIVDRLKETMKYRGIQISPTEIENLLQTDPDVIEVAVVGIPHILDDEHPIAFVTKVPGSKVSERDLEELVAKNMTDPYHLRGGVKFLEKMPHTASRKISRKDLKAMAKSYQSNNDFIVKDNILKGKEELLSTEYTNIGQLLLDRMKAKPDFIGQIDVITEETYTYAEMFDRTIKCALWLRQQGIKANDVVAVCAPNIMDSFVPIFASFCVGAIFTGWNVAMGIREARHFMKLSGAKIVFTDESAVGIILEAAKLENHDIKVVVLGKALNALSFSKVLEGHSKFDVENFECAQIDNFHNTAALLFSSGTTGNPKGVRISHFFLLNYLLLPNDFNVIGVPFWLSQYFWISGILLTFNSVVNYNRRLLYPAFEEEMLCKIIEKYKVTWIFLSPSMANRILKSGYFKKYDVSSIIEIYVGGAIFTAESQIKLQECLSNGNVLQMYGLTEVGLITVQKPHHKAGSIGTVRRNAQIKIIDLKTKCVLGPNQTGELLGKSLTMMNGYYNNPQATKDAIDDDGWFHTGDLAYYDEDGEFFIVDRLKETMKYRGIQISPTEIENLLQTHPDVFEVAVVGIPHILDDEHPIAFVTKVPGSKVSERDLEELVEKNMTDPYHLRGGVKFLEYMPYTVENIQSTNMDRKLINSKTDFIKEGNVFKGKEVPFSTEYTNIGKLLLDRMKAKPDFIGQIDVITEETYTFAEMFDQTVKCALWLRQQGIKANDVVAVCTPYIMDSFTPIFASFCVAAIFTSWNYSTDIGEARYLMKLSGAKIVFADESSVGTILEAAKLENHDIKVVVFGKASDALPFATVIEGHNKSDVERFECAQIDNIQDTAAILYTSGTTGLPKGVKISHSALLCNVLLPSFVKGDVIPLWMTPYFWISGVLLTLSSVVNYTTRLLYPSFDEEMTCKIIEKYKVTWVFMSPSMANRLIKSGYYKKYDVSSAMYLCVSGCIFSARSQVHLQECFPNGHVIQIYGITELGGTVTTQKLHHKAGSVGEIVKNVQIKIVDSETKTILGPNKIGEILIKSLNMMNGYYNNPQATKDAIDKDGWFHTGDLAYYDEKGQFFFVDRLKEMIKYRGYQVSPCEIENLLQTHPDVVETAVVGVPNLQDDEHPIAFVIKVPGSKVTERELEELVAKNMTERNHLRAGVIFLEKMPYTPSEKISRRELKAIAKRHLSIQ
ncbi:uncharacterized protein LOC118449950 [Vespa mandarinia]|uniref:uncharacterized protein LOC118449950 n=1 Tax=Vespa mandarinia TaxID=7446 RepID=UPI0016229A75|nr:uncharacterized protein LOC118449950 [Vespa mandarinia]